MKKYLIKEYRQMRDLTQKQLAELVGCDQPAIARWENIEEDSETVITRDNIGKIAKALNVSADDIDCSIKIDIKELIYQARKDGEHIANSCSEKDLITLKQKILRDIKSQNRDEVCLDILQLSNIASYECKFFYELLYEKTMTSKFVSIVSSFVNGLQSKGNKS